MKFKTIKDAREYFYENVLPTIPDYELVKDYYDFMTRPDDMYDGCYADRAYFIFHYCLNDKDRVRLETYAIQYAFDNFLEDQEIEFLTTTDHEELEGLWRQKEFSTFEDADRFYMEQIRPQFSDESIYKSYFDFLEENGKEIDPPDFYLMSDKEIEQIKSDAEYYNEMEYMAEYFRINGKKIGGK